VDHHLILETLSLAVFLGILSQVIAQKLKMPAIIFLMLFGIIAGPQVLHLLHTDRMETITVALISVGVAIILFEGGMKLHLKDINIAPKAIFNIIFLGPFITMGTVAICLHFILNLNWGISFLTGSILTVSGPTVVGPLLERVGVHKKLKEILVWESIFADAVGGILMVVTLNLVVSGSSLSMDTLGHFLGRLALGGITGFLTGKFLVYIIPKKIIFHEQLSLVILSIILLVYWLSNHFASESGLLTVTIAGMMLAQLRHPALEEITAFKDQLSLLTVSVLFILLASRIDISHMFTYGWSIGVALLTILFVARPLMIFLTTIRMKINVREKLFMVWVAPRGVIAAATASLFTIILKEQGYPQAEALETIVFLIITCTVLLLGFTANPIAHLLKVTAPPRNGYLLVGIHEFSIAIANLLKNEGVPVKLVDNNEETIARAKAEGLEAHCGNIMDEEFLEGVGLDRIGTMLTLTSKDETNTLVCRLGRKLLGMNNAYQIVNTFLSDVTDEVLLNFSGLLAFDLKISIQVVNERLKNGRLKVKRLQLKKSDKGIERPSNLLFPLFFIEKGRVIIAKEDDQIRTTDLIALVMT
jgi:NhaP-type Na+/H+ or K+/H+ antiporter